MRGARGFSLLEAAFAVALVAAIVMALMVGLNSASRRFGERLQQEDAIALARDQAEQLLSDRRNPARSYAYLVAANYPARSWTSGAYAGLSRTVAFTAVAAGATGGAYAGSCPASTTGCRVAVITVSRGATSVATLTLLFVQPFTG